jgi:hypothetical protein
LYVDDPPLCLHASKISFVHPLTKQPVTFTAPAPVWAGISCGAAADNRAFSKSL